MNKGKLFGLGVGPGDPELLTLKAARIIEQCPVLAAPLTGAGGTLALDIVKQAVDISGKSILRLKISMTRDEEKRAAEYRAAAKQIAACLEQEQDVALVNLGDVTVFATFPYLAQLLREQGFQTEMVPGVTSFSAAAAAFNISLTERDRGLFILSARDDPEERLSLPGVKVLMKSGKGLGGLLSLLEEKGLLEKSLLAVNCGLPGEELYSDLSKLPAGFDPGYFALVIVKE